MKKAEFSGFGKRMIRYRLKDIGRELMLLDGEK